MVAEQQYTKHRLTPTLEKSIGKVYRPYYLLLAILGIGCCVGLIICASLLKDLDSNLKSQLFHIWVAIPIIIPAVFGILVFLFKSRKLAIFFLCLSVIAMVLCGAAAMMTGLRYWLDGWYSTRERLDTSGQCRITNGQCICDGIAKMPLKVKTCSDMEKAANLLVGEIVLSALGLVFNLAGAFLGFMTVCCGPWQYIDDYTEDFDVDRSSDVKFRLSKSKTSTQGNPNKGFSSD